MAGRRNVSIVIPIFRPPAEGLRTLLAALADQMDAGDEMVLVDSTPGGHEVPEGPWSRSCRIHRIPPEEFGHGRSRTLGARLARHELLVYLTQDVEPCEGAISRLVAALDPAEVGLAFGRQLPRIGAGPFEAFPRLFNYPAESYRRSWNDRHRYGIKTVFFSDSFAAYKREVLEACGYFPEGTIMGEDTLLAARALERGWTLAYEASACVRHSHDYTPLQEFRRYFDIGVFHADERSFLRSFGRIHGEGLRYAVAELSYLWRRGEGHRSFEWLLRTASKYLGYRLGRMHRMLPLSWKQAWSLHRTYWSGGEGG